MQPKDGKDQERKERGDILGDEDEMIIIGNDVVGLFPNITSARTGRIVRYKVQESSLKLEGMSFKQSSLYVYLNQDKTGDLTELRQYFPWRRKVKGTAPGMSNNEVNSRNKMGDNYWVSPRKEATDKHIQMMIARAAEIGTRTVFENFIYTF